MIAKVKWCNALKGIGFANAPGIVGDILFKYSPDLYGLVKGDRISCEILPPNPTKPSSVNIYGPRAINVRRL